MIYEKDYILRLIWMMGEMLRRLKREINQAAFDAGLDLFLRTQSGLPLKAVLGLDAESIRQATDMRGVLASAMALKARAERPDHTLDALSMREKALRLLVSLKGEEVVCREMAETVYALLKETLDVLDSAAIADAAAFLLEGGRYDLMDSAAYFLWEGLPEHSRAAWRPALAALYAPLQMMTDDMLVRGGLSRKEIGESLRVFAPEEERET